MKRMFFFFLILLSYQSFAQVDEALENRRANYQINDYYKAGSYLIFDCFRDYYTCVDEDGFKRCREKRQQDMEKKLNVFTCAPLKKFQTQTICAQKNYEVVEAVAKKHFCYPRP